jgi:hypothetical protein
MSSLLSKHCLMKHCSQNVSSGLYTCVSPDDLQDEHNGPLDSENGEHGGGLPPIPVGPAGGQWPWQHMQPQQPPMQPPQQQQDLAHPPLPPSPPSNSSRSSSQLSYMLDPAPTPAPHNTFSEILDDDQIAQLQEQECIAKMQWEHFSRGGPLFLLCKPGYEESKVIPPSWQEATDRACLENLRKEVNLPINPPQPQEEPLGSQPSCSGCERRPVVCPDNVTIHKLPWTW